MKPPRHQNSAWSSRLFLWIGDGLSRFDRLEPRTRRRFVGPLGLLGVFLVGSSVVAQEIEEVITRRLTGRMIIKEGNVGYQAARQAEKLADVPQHLGQGDALRTFSQSRATVLFTNLYPLRLKELTLLQILPPPGGTNPPALFIGQGGAYFTSRGTGPHPPVRTPHAEGRPGGTEFLVEVDPKAGRTTFTMFDGTVRLTTTRSNRTVRSGEQGMALADGSIEVLPVLKATNLVQWWIYYPGVPDPTELGLSTDEQMQLSDSLAAYRAADLQTALKRYPGYPTPPEPGTESKRLYYAGLLLTVGAVDCSQELLSRVSSNAPLARSLRTIIASVAAPLGVPAAASFDPVPVTASEHLALSYFHQAALDLKSALQSARNAATRSPRFGFAWARVAELEFGFGHTRAARQAVENALEFTPRNAQAHALRGFLLAAENRNTDAVAAFDRAIEIDPALGNAWLGRGLCRRRIGWVRQSEAGWLSDLQAAAILEPTRSLVRSYAGKAFADANDDFQARKELDFAKSLDPNDPTPWLYSALNLWEQHRFNEAIASLERSTELNDNRALFRSRLLLDEDQAVRSAGLAKIYRDAGLAEVAVREAAKAVSYDYGNYAGHLFLAESYDALRDPTRFNLRHETAWFNELLLANLFAPVGAGAFSQNISQQEYGRLFEANRLGLSTATEYRSDGQWRERATQFGTLNRFDYALDVDYQHNNGVRPNNELDRLEWYATLKFQLTPRNTLFALTKVQDYHSGDNFQYANGADARPQFTYDEKQLPIALAGFHREWTPGSHTLLLGGRLENDQRFLDQRVPTLVFITNSLVQPVGKISAIDDTLPLDLRDRGRLEIFTVEGQQIVESEHHRLIVGARWQGGDVRTRDQLTVSSNSPGWNGLVAPVDGDHTEDFQRINGYGYWTWKPVSGLQLTPGVSFDTIQFPRNFRHPPIGPGEEARDLLTPKAAVVWSPVNALTFRGAYSRELAGASLDESYRLEPVQLAGFSQASRTFISESLAGSVSAPKQEIAAFATDVKLRTRTYLGLEFQALRSRVSRTVGVFDTGDIIAPGVGDTPQDLDYHEYDFQFAFNQLLGEEWAVGALYRFTHSDLTDHFTEIPPGIYPEARTRQEAELHQVSLRMQYQHPCGFFASAEANWYGQSARVAQENKAFVPLNSDFFWQENLLAGWRFRHHRGDVTLGLLNLAGQDYHLTPLTPYAELPRERVFYARLRLNF